MNKKYDLIVFICRVQPPHVGHFDVIRSALEQALHVLILVGSAGKPRSIKNPWTHMERVGMLFDGIDSQGLNKFRVTCAPLYDQTYNDQKWATGVQTIVEEKLRTIGGLSNKPKVAIIGHDKDASSYYLKMFPQWDRIDHQLNEMVNATDIRKILFEGMSLRYLQGLLPTPVLTSVENFTKTSEFDTLVREYKYIQNYKRAWEAAPYPPTFVTTDAVVIQSGHVLLIRRKAEPGRGLFAMPGGFVNQHERLEDGMIRELREETKLKIPTPVLRGSIKFSKVYDAPDRSFRGRTITHAYLIELPSGELPKVKGGDDAQHAMWIPISDVKEADMFEDHWHIIQDMIGKL